MRVLTVSDGLTGMSVSLTRISPSAFYSIKFAEAEEEVYWVSFQKQEQGCGPTCCFLLWEEKARVNPGFGFIRLGLIHFVRAHREKADNICAEKSTHFRS